MKKAYCAVLSLLMVMSLCFIESGCSSSQFNKVISTIEAELPAAVALGGDIGTLLGNSNLGPDFQKFGPIFAADLPAVQQAVQAYQASKSTGTKNAIFAAVQSLVGDFNAQFLAVNTVTNQQSQQAILTKLAAFAAVANGFELVLAPFFNKSVSVRNSYQQIAPYIPREIQEKAARNYGYSLDQLGL